MMPSSVAEISMANAQGKPSQVTSKRAFKKNTEDGLWDRYQPTTTNVEQRFKQYRASPSRVLVNAHQGLLDLWQTDKQWACETLHGTVPHDLAISLFAQYVKKWEAYIVHKNSHRSNKSRTNQANVWLRKRINMVKVAVASFPVPLAQLKHDGARKGTAQLWANKCTESVVAAADEGQSLLQAVYAVERFATRWGFSVKVPPQGEQPLDGESEADFKARIAKANAGYRLARLVDDQWWFRQIDVAYGRFCEHCQILNGRVRKGVSIYLSEMGTRDYKARKRACEIALSKLVARNENTGEEINMLDIHNASVANPEIRRHELMLRMSGFQQIAEENKLISGFFTLTAPSQYHAYTAVNQHGIAKENTKYAGHTPTQTQQYMSSVWKKVRPALARLGIALFGFRVAEPHHDGCPHWHALFFFHPEHEQAIRYVIAAYFTQADRDELQINHQDMQDWYALVIGKTGNKQFIKNVDNAQVNQAIAAITQRIKARCDYKRMDPKKGTATGYIAKYIAKNIDGYKLENDTQTPADKAALAACGWASRWGIRQFQQIGGPPVSVWRELRRLPQNEGVAADKAAAKKQGVKYIPKLRPLTDLMQEEHTLEVARMAADSPNWAMYVHAMGGIYATRKTFPIRMVYKPVNNTYGENVKQLKGVGTVDKTLITHNDAWVIGKVDEKRDFDLQKSDRFSLGVLSITVREKFNESVIMALWSQFEQMGERLSYADFERFLLGGVILLSTRLQGDVIRQQKAKLKASYLDRGGYFIDRWESVMDPRCVYIEDLINQAPDKHGLIHDLSQLDALKQARSSLILCYQDSGWRTAYSVKSEQERTITMDTQARLSAVKQWCHQHKVTLITPR